MIGWVLVAIFGLIGIFIQLLMPDLIPEVIQSATGNSTYAGVSVVGSATVILWVIGGYAFFIGGIAMALRSYRQSH